MDWSGIDSNLCSSERWRFRNSRLATVSLILSKYYFINFFLIFSIRLYINKKITSLNINIVASTILLVPSLETGNYPINRLRNLAIQQCKTQFMFLVDADFQPSPNFEKYFTDVAKNYVTKQIVFVVPAFEYLENPDVSRSKNDPKYETKHFPFLFCRKKIQF